MFNRMRKSLSTHRSPKWTDDRFAPVMEDAERLLGNASASAPTTKRRSADREIARAPCSYTDQLNSASPAARRPKGTTMTPVSSIIEVPPAYTAGESQNTHAASSAPPTDIEEDDPYDFLRTFDTVFLIDDSTSMAGTSWVETGKALELIAPICTKRDADGIDIYFLNHPDSDFFKNVQSAGTVIEIFQNVRPSGATPTGQRLNEILQPYLQRLVHDRDIKPMNIIVITDGAPTDDDESPIIAAARKLDEKGAPAHQLGIQFIQVGNEPGARKHLMQLDDGLVNVAGRDGKGIPRDIVDTVPFTGDGKAELTGMGILKATTGAVNRRWDRTVEGIHRTSQGAAYF